MVVTRSQISNNVVTRGTKPVYVMKSYSTRSGPSNLRTTIWTPSSPVSVVAKQKRVAAVVPEASPAPVEAVEASPAVVETVDTSDSTVETSVPDTSVTETSVPDTSDSAVVESQEDQEVVEKQEFKSIIRTRAQKLNEAKMYHENMLTLLENHWNTYKREPDATNSALANYIQNLRSIEPTNLRPEFVDLVSQRLPWFKWEVTDTNDGWSRFAGNMARFSFLVMLVLGAAYLQVKLSEQGFVTAVYSKFNNFRLLNDISLS